MQKKKVGAIAIKSFALLVVLGTAYQAMAQDATATYPNMAPIEQYLMDRTAEIALARSWSEPLKWHTKIGHSFRERKHRWRERDTPGNFSEWPSIAWRHVKMSVS